MNISEKAVAKAVRESSRNQEIQMLLYRWRDRGCPYDSQMIDMVYEIIKIARKR